MVEPIGHTGGIIDPPRGIPADPARDLRPAQRPADLRRDHHRHRPHRADVRRRDVRRDARRALHGQGAERRLRAAVGDDLPAADRRRLLGADRREPRLRRGAHVRGQPDLLRRRHRRAARDPRARPVRQRPPAGRAPARPASSGWRRSTASSATSAARGCSRASSSSATRRRRSQFPDALRRARSAAGPWRTACLPRSTRTGSPSARRWRSPRSRSTRCWRCWTGASARSWPTSKAGDASPAAGRGARLRTCPPCNSGTLTHVPRGLAKGT